MIDRADALVAKLKDHDDFINIRVTGNYVLRMAILRGLEVMEADPSKAK